MSVFARVVFVFVDWAARNGLVAESSRVEVASAEAAQKNAREKGHARRRTGVRGETYAYWYLRRHGYTIIARNFTASGCKGEIDLIGYDGPVLAFVEVKTRSSERGVGTLPEDAMTPDKRRYLSRIARQFLAQRRVREATFRFDVVAIESRPGRRPEVRLHKGAFAGR